MTADTKSDTTFSSTINENVHLTCAEIYELDQYLEGTLQGKSGQSFRATAQTHTLPSIYHISKCLSHSTVDDSEIPKELCDVPGQEPFVLPPEAMQVAETPDTAKVLEYSLALEAKYIRNIKTLPTDDEAKHYFSTSCQPHIVHMQIPSTNSLLPSSSEVVSQYPLDAQGNTGYLSQFQSRQISICSDVSEVSSFSDFSDTDSQRRRPPFLRQTPVTSTEYEEEETDNESNDYILFTPTLHGSFVESATSANNDLASPKVFSSRSCQSLETPELKHFNTPTSLKISFPLFQQESINLCESLDNENYIFPAMFPGKLLTPGFTEPHSFAPSKEVHNTKSRDFTLASDHSFRNVNSLSKIEQTSHTIWSSQNCARQSAGYRLGTPLSEPDSTSEDGRHSHGSSRRGSCANLTASSFELSHESDFTSFTVAEQEDCTDVTSILIAALTNTTVL